MRKSVPTGNVWGDIVGYSRAVRVGNLIYVSGTAAVGENGAALHVGDPAGQTRIIFERIEAALIKLGGSLEHVVETCVYVCNMEHWEAVGRVHGEVFRNIKPASCMVEVSKLIAQDLLVEISAVACVENPAGA
jgi:enamine deaminase RidA (YjgF/YER057c/UK114 family)